MPLRWVGNDSQSQKHYHSHNQSESQSAVCCYKLPCRFDDLIQLHIADKREQQEADNENKRRCYC